MDKTARNRLLGVLAVLFFSNIPAWAAVSDFSKPQFLEVSFFDVGQGDAAFIETPENHQILIDGGPDSTILEKLSNEVPFWDNSLDLIILTHPEKDHLYGLLEVLKRYKVENILWTGVLRNTAEFKEWERLIEKEGAKIKIAQSGQKISAGEAVFEILFPLEKLEGKEFKDSNDTSIISRLVFGENSFLFTGDVYQSMEKEILEKGINVDSDILKVSHHGSKTSSDPEFIEKVSPDIAVISVSKENSYGHPHEATLETFKKYGIDILRTDQSSDIKIISNGYNLTIK